MALLHLVAAAVGCVVINQTTPACVDTALNHPTGLAQPEITTPTLTGSAIDVVLTAESAFAWDIVTGEALYEKAAYEQRPVASLSKLLTALTVRSMLPLDQVVEIPQEARRAQLLGANVKLPIGEHATVEDLLAASMIPSANDAAVALAIAAAGSEEAFVDLANSYAIEHGLEHTKLANATGLTGGEQYSTAYDISQMLSMAYDDTVLRPFLSQGSGVLTTIEGSKRAYKTTNQLLGTYLPVLAAKTGFTLEAGENLALISRSEDDQVVGAVVLGSTQRFQDMKILFEWMWRNFTWPSGSMINL